MHVAAMAASALRRTPDIENIRASDKTFRVESGRRWRRRVSFPLIHSITSACPSFADESAPLRPRDASRRGRQRHPALSKMDATRVATRIAGNRHLSSEKASIAHATVNLE